MMYPYKTYRRHTQVKNLQETMSKIVKEREGQDMNNEEPKDLLDVLLRAKVPGSTMSHILTFLVAGHEVRNIKRRYKLSTY